MRGIEAALKVLTSDITTGAFASEVLRKLADREKMKAPDISLASSLVYIMMRRKELWENIAGRFMRSQEKLPVQVSVGITMGTGGILELRRFSEGVLINGIIDYLKRREETAKYASVANAVLHKVSETGGEILEAMSKSSVLEERAMYSGIPVWSLPAWLKTWSRPELGDIFAMMLQPACASLRPTPGKLDELSALLQAQEIRYYPSDISSALRLASTVLPVNVPGFSSGLCTVQSESSILAASLVGKFYEGGRILDMCSGRGVKACQILQECPDSQIECWDISEGRSKSAAGEFSRLGLTDRAVFRVGDAVVLEPEVQPSFVVLDAPCSCSGTWTRKPESKWRLDWQKLDGFAGIQTKLLEHAVSLCKPGGHVLYVTCSLLKQENENVVAQVLMNHTDCSDMTGLIGWRGSMFRKGKPYGIYIWPRNAWLDGFYCALILKK
ncbi:MAG: RsmB/NOP family class I SAM-dependent RNA methyltransferase [Synergistaceae bacterium]|nr:RsmB/NOP family class I SAM-dependent RNA methyltransferase [Synergistaceae bacterium]